MSSQHNLSSFEGYPPVSMDSDHPSTAFAQPASPRSSRGRPVRSTRMYAEYETDSSAMSGSDDTGDEEEEEEDDNELQYMSDASQESSYGDSDSSVTMSKSNKKQTNGKQSSANQGVLIPMGTRIFEKIIDYRIIPETNTGEFLIKYRHASLIHAKWVPPDYIEKQHLGNHRMIKFLRKWEEEGGITKDFSEFTKIDRIIDEGEAPDAVTGETKVFYLVKWNNLPYDESTWESEDDVHKLDASKIEEFHTLRQIPDKKFANPPPRPQRHQFKEYTASPTFKYGNQLRSYQLEGLNWLRYCYYDGRSCILADEMGLGKTVQSIALLNDIYNEIGICGPFLIVAPLSTIPHWERAVKAWTDLSIVDFRGNATTRTLIHETEFYYRDMNGKPIPNRYKFDILITTYEIIPTSINQLREVPWKCAVFDEAHRLKNKQSKVGEILKMLNIEHKLLLTGTPIQNSLDELYSLLCFMEPSVYNDEKAFFAEYGSLKSATDVEKLQNLLKPIMLRRFKEDVETTIPVKEETVVEVELTSIQKKYYRAILERNLNFLKGNKTNREVKQLRNVMMELRKCCSHPYLIDGAEDDIVYESHINTPQESLECMVQSSGKLVLIDKLLRKLLKGNHKVLIFSQFTRCLDILSDYLTGRSYHHERIDGSKSSDERQASIDRFSTLPIEQSFVFLLCTRAGGVGINLTAADTCIIFDSDWNPQNDLQAQARCHRIGQTKPVQIYRLVCRNTYEKEMFDRAGMKLGLDKAVMQRMDSRLSSSDAEDGNSKSRSELSKKEIEDLLKKGAYGAMMDDEASAKFCEEDIDQILERRTTVIRHEGNEKGSVFSKATFSTTEDDDGVELDDPDFWEKWAAKANIDTTKFVDENDLIVYEPRKRRQVQRFVERMDDMGYSSNENMGDSDAYEDEEEKPRKKDAPRPWTHSEKTKYERKLMVYGYGRWDLMQEHFQRRTEKDLKAATRALMRLILPGIEKSNEEDRRLAADIQRILDTDAADEVQGDDTVPYVGANKRQLAEFRSFLIEAPADYIAHIQRKGRNILLRIQMLQLIREKIVPEDWEEAKQLLPKVTSQPPVEWWGANEDRDLLLGICKHGYQQYLSMRNDPEFCFYGKKYDDRNSGGSLDEEDPVPIEKKVDDTNQDVPVPMDVDGKDDDTVYVWPTKADIGMRLRRVIAAVLREQANDRRRQKVVEKEQKKESDRIERQRKKEDRIAEKQRAKLNEASNRWTKKNKADFLRTILSFGVETYPNDSNIQWNRFREISGLDKRTDESLDSFYRKFLLACKEIMRRAIDDHKAPSLSSDISASSPPASQGSDMMTSRESSVEPSQSNYDDQSTSDDIGDDIDDLLEFIPYDKARRSLRRIEQMKRIREQVVMNPDLDERLLKSRKTSGLPEWWEVPEHDKALLKGISRHGYGRADLITNDPKLPFYHVKQRIARETGIVDPHGEGAQEAMDKLGWPKDIIVGRRIETLCQLVLKPRPPSKRQLAASRKRKVNKDKVTPFKNAKIKLTVNGPKAETASSHSYEGDSSQSSSDSDQEGDNEEDLSDSDEDTDTILEEATLRVQKMVNGRSPTKPLKSQHAPRPHFISAQRSSEPPTSSESTAVSNNESSPTHNTNRDTPDASTSSSPMSWQHNHQHEHV